MSSEAAKPTTPSTRMTPSQWTEAKALWESGEFTLRQISDKVGVSREHLSRRFKKEKIEKGAKSVDTSEAVTKAIESEMSKWATILPARIAETKEQHYQWATTLSRLTMNTFAGAMKEGRPLSSVGEDLKSIDRASAILAKTMDQRYRALGLDTGEYIDETALPSLTIDIMTDDEMDDIRSQARERTLGIDDGLGGILEEEDGIVEEDFADEELESIEEELADGDDA